MKNDATVHSEIAVLSWMSCMASIKCWGIKDKEFSGTRGKSKDQRRMKRYKKIREAKNKRCGKSNQQRQGKINIFSIFSH